MEIRDRNHPEDSQGWDGTSSLRGAVPTTEFCLPRPSVRHNIEKWACAREGRATYSVQLVDMLSTVAALEAETRSAYSGVVESIH